MPNIPQELLDNLRDHNARLSEYIQRLYHHDWSFENSDDQGVRSRGQAERTNLEKLQAEFDPDFGIWNAYAPEDYKNGKTPKSVTKAAEDKNTPDTTKPKKAQPRPPKP